MFSLHEPPPEWVATAPIRIERQLHLAATPEEVFSVLIDHSNWPSWFNGMRRTRVDGAAAGVGALRTVWVGATRVQERFLVWEPSQRLSFAIVASSAPGLRSMVEDWTLAPTSLGTTLSITIGVQGAGPLRVLPGLLRRVVAHATRGAEGLGELFASAASAAPTNGG